MLETIKNTWNSLFQIKGIWTAIAVITVLTSIVSFPLAMINPKQPQHLLYLSISVPFLVVFMMILCGFYLELLHNFIKGIKPEIPPISNIGSFIVKGFKLTVTLCVYYLLLLIPIIAASLVLLPLMVVNKIASIALMIIFYTLITLGFCYVIPAIFINLATSNKIIVGINPKTIFDFIKMDTKKYNKMFITLIVLSLLYIVISIAVIIAYSICFAILSLIVMTLTKSAVATTVFGSIAGSLLGTFLGILWSFMYYKIIAIFYSQFPQGA